MLNNYGFVRVGAIVPSMRVADTKFNTSKIIEMIKVAYDKGIQILTFPELSITGYTCADLFHQNALLEDSINSLKRIINDTKDLDIISIVGMPLTLDNQLFNTAIVINKVNPFQ
jgi:NAD+ synthase (glutamine-hydrolysing)